VENKNEHGRIAERLYELKVNMVYSQRMATSWNIKKLIQERPAEQQ